ncbi:unnamed protein product [Prorocentrum cordatum]|uniref:Uncharacterized protein n=1 Tax=Prorocentrum cordatum TaxID=2364126 RepID=A0ABN9VQ46_9DINO|nr:unnamed protein product [Polarella glacialis]
MAEELRRVVRQSEHMWEMALGRMAEHVFPYRKTMSLLAEPMQDYMVLAARHHESLVWLLKHPDTDNFNRLISLTQPNTDDDPVILAAIASLKQTRTFLAEALYARPPYAGLRELVQELALLQVDEAVHSALLSVHQSYGPMMELITTHSRTPGVQAAHDLRRICEKGQWRVVCTTARRVSRSSASCRTASSTPRPWPSFSGSC